MYHRVASNVADPWGLCVSAGNFGQHMEVLRRLYRPVPLSQLASRRDLRNRMVAVTFDDGYADNLHTALPVLERNGIPATFFLTTGVLGGEREFWWDELERLLLCPPQLPRSLHVVLRESSHVFEVGGAAEPLAGSHAVPGATRPWEAARDTRLGFYYTVWQLLSTLSEAARQAALEQLRDQLAAPDLTRESHRSLTRQEAICLAAGAQIDIGAHSVTHGSLPAQSSEVQSWEMRQSKRDLEALIGRPVTGFAYPHGDYAPETLELARASGFEFACTVDGGCVKRNTQPLLLPRLSVAECTGAELARSLDALL
jgi:peptidoglycan/xylan/chitin deacetylase (PgdA/CDA1 family)